MREAELRQEEFEVTSVVSRQGLYQQRNQRANRSLAHIQVFNNSGNDGRSQLRARAKRRRKQPAKTGYPRFVKTARKQTRRKLLEEREETFAQRERDVS